MIEAQNTRKEALFVPQNIQRCFQRYEKKYLLNLEQYQKIRAGLAPYMEADEHGRYTICNLYYDTPDFQLIRASLDKPVYKEKLRMRSLPSKNPSATVRKTASAGFAWMKCVNCTPVNIIYLVFFVRFHVDQTANRVPQTHKRRISGINNAP